MKKSIVFLILFILTMILARFSFAEELHIDKDGNFYIQSSPVTSANNNFVVVRVWGTKWTVFMDVGATVLGADELDLKMSNIQTGHVLTVEGKYNEQYKYIDARKVIDESIGEPKIKDSPVSSISSFAPAVTAIYPSIVSIPQAPNTPVSKLVSYLRVGSRGSEVTFLQKFLLSNGFITADNVTGYFGPATKKGLVSFQEAYGLGVVGMTGPITRSFINSFDPLTVKKVAPKIIPPSASVASISNNSAGSFVKYLVWGMEGEEVRKLQLFLNDKGFLTADNVTGFFGWATHTALIKFQKTNGLEASGTLGPMTRALMNGM